jgi:D-inositol-3-phosphate glycosyltransferase
MTGQADRVLLVSHYLPPHIGGIESVVHAQAELLARSGRDVIVASTTPGEPAQPDQVPVRRVTLPAWNGIERRTGVPFPLLAPSAVVLLWRAVRVADVVHLHDVLYMTSWLAALCAILQRRRFVLTQHVHRVAHPSRLVMGVQDLVYATIGRAIVRRAAAISYLNGHVAKFLHRLGAAEEQLVFLPNVVDTSRFRPARAGEKHELRRTFGLPVDATLVLFVGRFVPKKGFEKLLAAADDAYLLVLVGGPAPADWTGDPRVIFLGARSPAEIRALYRAGDVFVLPSEAEGFPVTVQEAMASGLPIVTSDDPGYTPYGLDRGRLALINPTAPAIKTVLRQLSSDPARRDDMSAYSRQYATRAFDEDRQLAALAKLHGTFHDH